MAKLLHFSPIVIFLISTLSLNAQDLSAHSSHDHTHATCKHGPEANDSTEKLTHYFGMKRIPHIAQSSKDFVSPEINNEYNVALIDVITSDEEANFNCSAGFCMNSGHFHKKGLTLNRQLFDYFLSISG